MTEFIFVGCIAGILELMLIAGGFILLHFAARDSGTRLLSASGWVMIVGGILAGACTMYYWVRFEMQDSFGPGYPYMHGQTHGYYHDMGYPNRMMPHGMMYDDGYYPMNRQYHDRMMRGWDDSADVSGSE